MKSRRQSALLEIIQEYDVDTQEELQEKLKSLLYKKSRNTKLKRLLKINRKMKHRMNSLLPKITPNYNRENKAKTHLKLKKTISNHKMII